VVGFCEHGNERPGFIKEGICWTASQESFWSIQLV
jgi:hypothetical protein